MQSQLSNTLSYAGCTEIYELARVYFIGDWIYTNLVNIFAWSIEIAHSARYEKYPAESVPGVFLQLARNSDSGRCAVSGIWNNAHPHDRGGYESQLAVCRDKCPAAVLYGAQEHKKFKSERMTCARK